LGEILELVGATKVVFPNKEAAKRITPLLFSSTMLNYMPVSDTLSIAELKIPDSLVGKSLIQSGLREKNRLNLVSIRDPAGEFAFCPANYIFKQGDIGLFSGNNEDLNNFAVIMPKETIYKSVTEKLMRLFRKKP
jgi:trk system potassium uptake protein TrkA